VIRDGGGKKSRRQTDRQTDRSAWAVVLKEALVRLYGPYGNENDIASHTESRDVS